MAGDTTMTPAEVVAGVAEEPIAEGQPESEQKVKEANIHAMVKLTEDPEFKNLIRRLNTGEQAVLTEDVQMHGCRDPLVVWKGRNIILDGHHRYEICQKHGIPFQIVELEFPDEIEAKIWMLKNQGGRRNMNESQRAMAAVTLEALYSEQAKERMGARTDLGQDLDPSEAGRSAEKAAKDMGVSHQTVSFAKKVTTSGIPELAKLVESGEVAVSAAARAASQSTDVQRLIVEKAEAELRDGKKPHIAAIIRDIASRIPGKSNNDADKCLDRFRRSQEEGLKLLEGIDRIVQPENIVGIREMTQKIVEKLKEIEIKSLDPGQDPSLGNVIEVRHFKALMDSIVPINNQIRLKSEITGMRVVTSDYMGKKMVDAFLPKESFAKYEEFGEIGLDASVTQEFLRGNRKSMRFIVDRNDDKLQMTFGAKRSTQGLLLLDYLPADPTLPDPDLSCRLIVSSKEFVHALESAKGFLGTNIQRKKRSIVPDVRFVVSDGILALVCKTPDNDQMSVTCTGKVEEQTGQVNSRFNLDELLSIKQTILGSEEVKLGLGMLKPMILDLTIDKTKIQYFVDSLDAT